MQSSNPNFTSQLISAGYNAAVAQLLNAARISQVGGFGQPTAAAFDAFFLNDLPSRNSLISNLNSANANGKINRIAIGNTVVGRSGYQSGSLTQAGSYKWVGASSADSLGSIRAVTLSNGNVPEGTVSFGLALFTDIVATTVLPSSGATVSTPVSNPNYIGPEASLYVAGHEIGHAEHSIEFDKDLATAITDGINWIHAQTNSTIDITNVSRDVIDLALQYEASADIIAYNTWAQNFYLTNGRQPNNAERVALFGPTDADYGQYVFGTVTFSTTGGAPTYNDDGQLPAGLLVNPDG